MGDILFSAEGYWFVLLWFSFYWDRCYLAPML